MGGKQFRGGVVEQEGRRQGQGGRGGEVVAQFDGGQGVEALFREELVGLHRVGGRVSEDRRGQVADQGEQCGAALGRAESGEPGGGGRCRPGARRAAAA
nr:hypothetical protein [Streptomyces sp. RPA4-2]QIY60362.1 hypothetical protein HEP85_00745 [Streptomyces sp. RPA4-2]